MRLSDFANAYKHSLSGAIVGVTGAGVSCWLTDQLVKLSKLNSTSDSVHRWAELLIAMSSATAIYVVADNVLGRIGSARMDPTNGVFFNLSFVLAQPRLTMNWIGSARMLKEAIPSIAPCCDDCAEGKGKPCAGK